MEPDESLSERAYRILSEKIVTCQLSPGDRLAQSYLSKQMGIGLTPIRDALQRLALEGFVEVIPRLGYIVTSIDISYINDIFEMRQILEQAAVDLASRRATDDVLEAIRKMADFQYKFKKHDSYLDFLQRNVNFHLAITNATGNLLLINSLSKLLVEMTRIFHFGLDLRDSADEMRTEHLLLAEALQSHDTQKAVSLIKHQIDSSKSRIIEALNSNSQIFNKAQGRRQLRPDTISWQENFK